MIRPRYIVEVLPNEGLGWGINVYRGGEKIWHVGKSGVIAAGRGLARQLKADLVIRHRDGTVEEIRKP